LGKNELMNNRTTLIWGIALTSLGLLGFLVAGMLAGTSYTDGEPFSSAGQRIYYTGVGADGLAIPRTLGGAGMSGLGMMGDVTCVDCHGEDGRGGNVGMMFGGVEIPDIRYSELASARSEEGTTVPAWTDRDIARAIRDGIEPDGGRIKAPMPRWDMTDAELTDVIGYLKELDGR